MPIHIRIRPSALLFTLLILALNRPAQAQWGPEARIPAGREVFYRSIAASGTTVHVAWGDGQLGYVRSTDEGATWGQIQSLGSGELSLDKPLIADGNNLYMIAIDNLRTVTDFVGPRQVGDIFLRVSRDNGTTWSSPTPVTTSRAAFRISVAIDASGRLHVAWMDYRSLNTWSIYYRRALNATMDPITFEPEILLVQGTNGLGAERPQLVAAGNSLHLAWMDGRATKANCVIENGFTIMGGCFEVYYKRSVTGGTSWDADVRLTNDVVYSGRPDVTATPSGSVLICYDHAFDIKNTAGLEQYFFFSKDNGATWPALGARLTNAMSDSTHGSITVAGARAHVAWFDERRGTNSEIYYRQSLNSETDWSAASVNWDVEEKISNGTAVSSTPVFASTKNYLHVLWGDNRTGIYESWYRRRALPATPLDVGAVDGGTVPGTVNGTNGCGCRIAQSPSGGEAWAAGSLAVVMLAALRRRRQVRGGGPCVGTAGGSSHLGKGEPT